MNKTLIKACVGCESTSMIQAEVTSQILKLEQIKEQADRNAFIFNSKKTPTQLSYLLKKNSKGPTMSPMTKLNSSGVTQSQAQLKSTPSFLPKKTIYRQPVDKIIT